MSGWHRIAIVITVLLAVPALYIGYDSSRTIYKDFAITEEQVSAYEADPDAFWSAFWARVNLSADEKMSECDRSKVSGRMSLYFKEVTVSCERTTYNRINQGIRYAFWPVIIMLILTWTIGWIVDGFRKSP